MHLRGFAFARDPPQIAGRVSGIPESDTYFFEWKYVEKGNNWRKLKEFDFLLYEEVGDA